MYCYRVSLLGTFQVTSAGYEVGDFATRRARALLAYLLVESHAAHPRQKLAAFFWPDHEEKAALACLRQTLYLVKKALKSRQGDEQLLSGGPAIRLNPHFPHYLDTAELERATAQCQRRFRHGLIASPIDCQRLEGAVSLYRGLFLEDLALLGCEAYLLWREIRQAQFHQLALNALGWLGDHCEGQRQLHQANAYAQREIELEPSSESAHRRRMRCLARLGNSSAAVHQFASCRRFLAEELGMEPSPKTVDLFERIRNGSRGV